MFTSNIYTALGTGNPSNWLTDDELKAQLTADVRALFATGGGAPRLSNDTVRGLNKQRVTPDGQAKLRETLDPKDGGKIDFHQTRAMQYRGRFDIQKPTDDTFLGLAEEAPGHLINGVEPPIDLPVAPSREVAKTIVRELSLIITMRWSDPTARTQWVGDSTFYLKGRAKPVPFAPKTPRNLIIYVQDDNSVRIETKYFTAYTCTKRGIRHGLDLVGLDHVELIDKDIRASAISEKKLYNKIAKAARAYFEFVTEDDPDHPITIEDAEDLIREEVAAAIDDVRQPGHPDVPVQDLINCHQILHDAAEHVRLRNILKQAPLSNKGARMRNFEPNPVTNHPPITSPITPP